MKEKWIIVTIKFFHFFWHSSQTKFVPFFAYFFKHTECSELTYFLQRKSTVIRFRLLNSVQVCYTWKLKHIIYWKWYMICSISHMIWVLKPLSLRKAFKIMKECQTINKGWKIEIWSHKSLSTAWGVKFSTQKCLSVWFE